MSIAKKCPLCQATNSKNQELGSIITDDDNWISLQLHSKKAELVIVGEGSENEQANIPINYCPGCGRQLRTPTVNVEPEENRQYYADI